MKKSRRQKINFFTVCYGTEICQASGSFYMQGITALNIIFGTSLKHFGYDGFQLQISPIKNKCRCDSGTPKSNHDCFDNNLEADL